MTREERKKAIEVLDDMKVKIDIPKAAKTQNDRNWALDIAIKTLSQEPCKDTISREDVIKLVECSGYDLQFRTDNADMCDDVRKLPPVMPSRPKGHWIHLRCDMYECSECGKIHTSFEIGKCDADYCPKCGVEMESEE